MRHLSVLADGSRTTDHDIVRATGRFYTSRPIADHLLGAVWRALAPSVRAGAVVRACDPFAGDGRLIVWLIEYALREGRHDIKWELALWDLYEPGLARATEALLALAAKHGIQISVVSRECDAIMTALEHEAAFDVVVTNPPWENLKPDRREYERLSTLARDNYVTALREYDILLGLSYPLSQPERKFAGWGTNLSRVGVEAALRLAAPSGLVGIVSPASLLADDSSAGLRKWMLTRHTLLDAAYIPSEARQFKGADVSTAVVVLRREESIRVAPRVTVYDSAMRSDDAREVYHPSDFLRRTGYVIPISFGIGRMDLLLGLSHLPTWGDLEEDDLWAGRELDETGVDRWLSAEGIGLFAKGRMIERLGIAQPPTQYVARSGWRVPASVAFERIAWRDVSRPSQKRRVIATLIPAGWIAGNSLGVAYFRAADGTRLRALLAVMSSLVFEFQLRCFLATGHVSLSALRKVHVPDLTRSDSTSSLAVAVADVMAGLSGSSAQLEAAAAHAYGITRLELANVMAAFPRMAETEREDVLQAFDAVAPAGMVS